ncbi:MAG: hypothetical protein JJW00_02775 [Sulfurimonas sp.]|nr:hypothetical protein [Sulfurimonas sp.]
MKINKQDFLNIKLLLEKHSITEGKFLNKEIVVELKNNGSIVGGKKTPKVRYIDLAIKENIFLFLKNNNYNIESIDDIDRYIKEIFDTKAPRAKVQKWHNNSKTIDSKSLKGLYVSSLKTIDIKLNGEPLSIVPNNGVGYFLFYTQKVELFEDTVIVGVENYQVVWFAKKYRYFFNQDKIIFVVINPYMLEWISGLTNEYIHFGDYDLAGIGIYLNKIVPRLSSSKKHSMFIPDNIKELIEKYGDHTLYEKQKQYKELNTNNIKIDNLIKIIKTFKKSIEQEGLYLLQKNDKE